jgi:hypothetical protein
MKSSETLTKIAPALVKALAELKGVAKDSKNPHFKNDYASLEAVIDTARPVLASHGLAFMQGLGEFTGGAMTVSTRILHDSGEWIESDFQMPVSKSDPQGTASASTYARRYSLMGILGLPAVDDDGEGAMQRNGPQTAQKPPQRLTEDQQSTILALMDDVGADRSLFLKYMGVASVSEIIDYDRAVAALESKRAK